MYTYVGVKRGLLQPCHRDALEAAAVVCVPYGVYYNVEVLPPVLLTRGVSNPLASGREVCVVDRALVRRAMLPTEFVLS